MSVHFKPNYRLSSFAPDLTLMRHVGPFIPHISLHPGVSSHYHLSPPFFLLVPLYGPTSLLFLFHLTILQSHIFVSFLQAVSINLLPLFSTLVHFHSFEILATSKMRKTTSSFFRHFSLYLFMFGPRYIYA